MGGFQARQEPGRYLTTGLYLPFPPKKGNKSWQEPGRHLTMGLFSPPYRQGPGKHFDNAFVPPAHTRNLAAARQVLGIGFVPPSIPLPMLTGAKQGPDNELAPPHLPHHPAPYPW